MGYRAAGVIHVPAFINHSSAAENQGEDDEPPTAAVTVTAILQDTTNTTNNTNNNTEEEAVGRIRSSMQNKQTCIHCSSSTTSSKHENENNTCITFDDVNNINNNNNQTVAVIGECMASVCDAMLVCFHPDFASMEIVCDDFQHVLDGVVRGLVRRLRADLIQRPTMSRPSSSTVIIAIFHPEEEEEDPSAQLVALAYKQRVASYLRRALRATELKYKDDGDPIHIQVVVYNNNRKNKKKDIVQNMWEKSLTIDGPPAADAREEVDLDVSFDEFPILVESVLQAVVDDVRDNNDNDDGSLAMVDDDELTSSSAGEVLNDIEIIHSDDSISKQQQQPIEGVVGEHDYLNAYDDDSGVKDDISTVPPAVINNGDDGISVVVVEDEQQQTLAAAAANDDDDDFEVLSDVASDDDFVDEERTDAFMMEQYDDDDDDDSGDREEGDDLVFLQTETEEQQDGTSADADASFVAASSSYNDDDDDDADIDKTTLSNDDEGLVLANEDEATGGTTVEQQQNMDLQDHLGGVEADEGPIMGEYENGFVTGNEHETENQIDAKTTTDIVQTDTVAIQEDKDEGATVSEHSTNNVVDYSNDNETASHTTATHDDNDNEGELREMVHAAIQDTVIEATADIDRLEEKQDEASLHGRVPILEFGSDANKILDSVSRKLDKLLRLVKGKNKKSVLSGYIQDQEVKIMNQLLAGENGGVQSVFRQQLVALREHYGRRFESMIDGIAEDDDSNVQARQKKITVAASQAVDGFKAAAHHAVPKLCSKYEDLNETYHTASSAELDGLLRDLMEVTSTVEDIEGGWESAVTLEEMEDSDCDDERAASKKPPKWYEKLAARALVLGINYAQGLIAIEGLRRAAADRDQFMPKFPLF